MTQTGSSKSRRSTKRPAKRLRKFPAGRAGRAHRRRDWWARLPDEELLDLRLCDLKLTIRGSWLEERLGRLYEELEEKGIRFRPHAWLSSEWFSPDGVPGIAIPFYLGHPRLIKLEEKQLLQAEGGSNASCLRILRHETGHCLDTAYQLHRRKRWRELFGLYSLKYPSSYQPRPNSRKFVLHLGSWYAQAHPAEDFAETFAVWLTPRSRWRQRYQGWPALKKLEYVDEVMRHIAAGKALGASSGKSGGGVIVRSRRHYEPLSELRITLREHYRLRKQHYSDDWPDFFDSDLRKLFSADKRYCHRPTAAAFLRKIRPELRDSVAQWTNTHPYTINQVLGDMIERCKELNLRLTGPERQARTQAMMMITVQVMNYIHDRRYCVAL